MLGDIRQARNIYIVCGYTDMRKGLNSLVPFVQQNFGIDPYSSSLFLFCGKRCDRLKALLWEPDGFVLLYKRLDNGRYQWPRNAQEVKPLTWEQFTWLMQGLNIEHPSRTSERTGIIPLMKKSMAAPGHSQILCKVQ